MAARISLAFLCVLSCVSSTSLNADIDYVPVSSYNDLRFSFDSLNKDHKRVSSELDRTKLLLRSTLDQLNMEHRRKKLMDLFELKGLRIRVNSMYYLYDVYDSVVKRYLSDEKIRDILRNEDIKNPFSLIVSVSDLESGANPKSVSKPYKWRGRVYYDVGLYNIQIPAWTSSKKELERYAWMGVVPNDGRWHLGIAIDRLTDPWINSDVFGKIIRGELVKYRDVRLALTSYNGWRYRDTTVRELITKINSGDDEFVNRHLNDIYYRLVEKRYKFYVGKI